MAFDPKAHKALTRYVDRVLKTGVVHRDTIRDAVILTDIQRVAISVALEALWGRAYPCPLLLSVKPDHGYRSRVIGDGFTPEQYVEWLVLGCSDAAEVKVEDGTGRPYLLVADVVDHRNVRYDVIVPIRSDALGFVHIDGMIPKGLF